MFSQFGNSHYFYRWLREISYILPVHKIRFKAPKAYICFFFAFANIKIFAFLGKSHFSKSIFQEKILISMEINWIQSMRSLITVGIQLAVTHFMLKICQQIQKSKFWAKKLVLAQQELLLKLIWKFQTIWFQTFSLYFNSYHRYHNSLFSIKPAI